MKSRWIPYATTPARLLRQLVSDVVMITWAAIWVWVGSAVYSAVSTIAEFGYQLEGGANGVAGNLDNAGNSADDVPFADDDARFDADDTWLR